jgi:hypothetical protein
VIFELRPPRGAGPLLVGTPGQGIVEVLKQLGVPQVLCRTSGSRPAWGVHRPSGLFICTYFDADDRLEAIEFGRATATTTQSPTTGMTCSPRQRQTSSPNCDRSSPSTRKRTGTPSPHPACFYPSGGRSRQTHQTTRKADSSKASSLRGLAITTTRLSQTHRSENDQSTGLDDCSTVSAPTPAPFSVLSDCP